MDLTRLAVDAGQFINRAVQYTGESLGQADKTELEPGLEELIARVDATKTRTDQIISQTEVLLQPSPGARLEDRLYAQLEWSVPPRPRAHELVGDQMTQAGMELGSNTPYGSALMRCGEAQKQLGEAERQFVQSTNIHFLTPLRSFAEGEYRAIQDERKMLVNKRLDLDIAKTRVRKAHEAEQEARSLNANPLDDDYMSHVSYMFSFLRVKWLKIWAQEISQAEMELRICQSLFDRQSEITRRVLEGISSTHTNHMRSLSDFVDAQACYFAQCNRHAQELQKQLASIPAVLCSNNWQSAINNAANEPSTSNHVANEPVGLNQVTPMPVVVHQLPDFDQDSWTVNSPSKTEKNTRDSSLTALPTDQLNNNNNNNTFSTYGQTSEISGQSSDLLCTSNQTHPLQPASKTDAASSQTLTFSASATSGAGSVTTTAALPPSQPTSSEPQTANAVTVESVAANGAAADPQTASETKEQPIIKEEDVQEPSSDGQDVLQ
ncbi:endophilin-B1-like [Stegastes partitus]|uniref:Endophilin-B1-like n=1 Tax=Stegastes partitus TaxID=144197 RepID=A0A3B4Z456_9TELE|nr:PREDICTED: endophilin-B1-like [Stegastes partitus]